LIVREVNAIGSAYHLLDVLPFADQPALRHLFADYIDARLKTYEVLSNPGALEKEVQSANHIYSNIWSLSVTACRVDAGGTAARLLLPALNEMNDVNTARTVALDIHLPKPILGLLMSVALLSALMAGYAMSKRKQRSPLHAFLYAVIIAITTYAVLDFDNPRSGFIRIDSADRALVELRKSIE
jgi:hypothetical protein